MSMDNASDDLHKLLDSISRKLASPDWSAFPIESLLQSLAIHLEARFEDKLVQTTAEAADLPISFQQTLARVVKASGDSLVGQTLELANRCRTAESLIDQGEQIEAQFLQLTQDFAAHEATIQQLLERSSR